MKHDTGPTIECLNGFRNLFVLIVCTNFVFSIESSFCRKDPPEIPAPVVQLFPHPHQSILQSNLLHRHMLHVFFFFKIYELFHLDFLEKRWGFWFQWQFRELALFYTSELDLVLISWTAWNLGNRLTFFQVQDNLLGFTKVDLLEILLIDCFRGKFQDDQ